MLFSRDCLVVLNNTHFVRYRIEGPRLSDNGTLADVKEIASLIQGEWRRGLYVSNSAELKAQRFFQVISDALHCDNIELETDTKVKWVSISLSDDTGVKYSE
jgi:hypothetical protein